MPLRNQIFQRLSKAVIAVAVASLLATPLQAWEPDTTRAIVKGAVLMMPASLRIIFTKRQSQLLAGVADGRRAMSALMSKGNDDKQLIKFLVGQSAAIAGRMAKQRNSADLSGDFGFIAGALLEFGAPSTRLLNIANPVHLQQFNSLIETNHHKFVLTFDGHHQETLDLAAWSSHFASIQERTNDYVQNLQQAFFTDPTTENFGDRKPSFAITALAYTHAFSDITRLWVAIWRTGGGDMTQTPFLPDVTAEPSKHQ